MKRHFLFVTVMMTLVVAASTKTICLPDGSRQKVSVRHDGVAFTVTAPTKWIVNQTENLPDGFVAVMTPEGQHWRSSNKSILVTVYSNNETKGTRLESLVNQDAASLKENSPSTVVTRKPSIITKSGKVALINQVVNRGEKSWQALAYIKENRSVILLMLSCGSEVEFNDAWLTFRRVVASYQSGKGKR